MLNYSTPPHHRKLSALVRIRKYLDFKKIRILFEEFFEAQKVQILSLLWMFYSRSTNRKNKSFTRKKPLG